MNVDRQRKQEQQFVVLRMVKFMMRNSVQRVNQNLLENVNLVNVITSGLHRNGVNVRQNVEKVFNLELLFVGSSMERLLYQLKILVNVKVINPKTNRIVREKRKNVLVNGSLDHGLIVVNHVEAERNLGRSFAW